MADKKVFDESKMHHGHRERLICTALKVGLENMQEINVLEIFLMLTVPRADVNPLAHRLLHEFGSVANVLNSNIETLVSFKGLGEQSAKKLILMPELFSYYTQSMLKDCKTLKNYGDVADYYDETLRFMKVENILLVALDVNLKIITKKIVASGSQENVLLMPTKIASFLDNVKSKVLVIGHNHPGGSAMPSDSDIKSHEKIKQLLQTLGVRLLANVIVGIDGVYNMDTKDFIRVFNQE